MNLLLNTHALIWFFNGDTQLSDTAKTLIVNPVNRCFVSIASIWEMGIKVSLNKLDLQGSLAEVAGFLEANDIQLLPIGFEHILALQELDFHHRDPFDRIIIAQAKTEGLTLITKDAVFQQYGAAIVWE